MFATHSEQGAGEPLPSTAPDPQSAPPLLSSAAAQLAATVARLKASFVGGRKILLVTYSLPVILRKAIDPSPDDETGGWSASWVEDDFIARSPSSIADDVDTIWVGCVTRDCVEAATLERLDAALPVQPSSAAAVGGPARGKVLTSLTAGGVYNPGGCGRAPPPSYTAASRSRTTSSDDEGPAFSMNDDIVNDILADIPANDDTGLAAPHDTELPIAFSAADMRGITAALNASDAVPIFLPPRLHGAYASYCLSVLKPAMHNILETGAQRMFPYAGQLNYLSRWWTHYLRANELIARVIYALTTPTDVIWLHDFHLCMVPRFLTQWAARAAPGDSIRPHCVFFWHSPFPTSEIFRTVPVRDELLGAVLECDVVGFHTYNYARHFLHSCKRLLGISFQSQTGGALALDVHGRDVLVSISHVGVEANALDRWMVSPEAAVTARALAARHPGKVLFAGIDTCQRLSGVALKLLAFERLLEDNPIYRRTVVLVQWIEMKAQVLTEDARRTSAELRERVARIRSTYGDVIEYEERPFYPPTARAALFHAADVLLQTPIREGLNLLPLEYVYMRTQWQIMRSTAVAAELQAEIDANGGAVASPPATINRHHHHKHHGESASSTRIFSGADTPATAAGSHHHHGRHHQHHRKISHVHSISSNAAIPGATSSHNTTPLPEDDQAVSDAAAGGDDALDIHGMPRHYATLAAPPRSQTPERSDSGGPGGAGTPSPRQLSGGRGGAGWQHGPRMPLAGLFGAPSTLPVVEAAAHNGSADSTIVETTMHASAGAVATEGVILPLAPPLRGGCVILSEFSTASHILNSNLLVNPWNVSRVAKEMDAALLMPDHERSFRQWRDYQYAIRNPAAAWSRQVISDVLDVRHTGLIPQIPTALKRIDTATIATPAASPQYHALPPPSTPLPSATIAAASGPPLLDKTAVVNAFRAAQRRLIIVDYGGTIMNREATSRADFTVDGYSKHIPSAVLDSLATLSGDPRNTVYVVSGLRSAAIDVTHLSRLPHIGLACENGMIVSRPLTPPAAQRHALTLPLDGANALGDEKAHSRVWVPLTPADAARAAEWAAVRSRAVEIMAEYQWRVNGAVTRVYDSLVAWDFRNADGEWAAAQAKFVAADLEAYASKNVKVTIRKSRVEVSLRAMNKGQLVTELLQDATSSREADSEADGSKETAPAVPLDFVLIAGDDATDEEMHHAMAAWSKAHGGVGVSSAALVQHPAPVVTGDVRSPESPLLRISVPHSNDAMNAPQSLPSNSPAVFTIAIGRSRRTAARFQLPDVDSMQRLLIDMAQASR